MSAIAIAHRCLGTRILVSFMRYSPEDNCGDLPEQTVPNLYSTHALSSQSVVTLAKNPNPQPETPTPSPEPRMVESQHWLSPQAFNPQSPKTPQNPQAPLHRRRGPRSTTLGGNGNGALMVLGSRTGHAEGYLDVLGSPEIPCHFLTVSPFINPKL